MKNARNEPYKPLSFQVRLMICITIVLALSMFVREGAYRKSEKISVGYYSENAERFMTYCVKNKRFEKNYLPVVFYAYRSDWEVIHALSDNEIRFAVIDCDPTVLFDNKMTDNRMIMCIKIDNRYKIAVCVRKELLEEHLRLAKQFAEAIFDETAENIEIVPMEQWIDECLSEGYSEGEIMQSAIPDFVAEMLE